MVVLWQNAIRSTKNEMIGWKTLNMRLLAIGHEAFPTRQTGALKRPAQKKLQPAFFARLLFSDPARSASMSTHSPAQTEQVKEIRPFTPKNSQLLLYSLFP
jgi:hypothetical protein